MNRNWTSGLGVLAVIGLIMLPACQTREQGIKSNQISQYGRFVATPADATNAAADVLEELDLKKVNKASTKVDGEAWGYLAQGEKVTVDIKQYDKNPSMVEVTTYVGTLGDPNVGIEIMGKIKERLSGDDGDNGDKNSDKR